MPGPGREAPGFEITDVSYNANEGWTGAFSNEFGTVNQDGKYSATVIPDDGDESTTWPAVQEAATGVKTTISDLWTSIFGGEKPPEQQVEVVENTGAAERQVPQAKQVNPEFDRIYSRLQGDPAIDKGILGAMKERLASMYTAIISGGVGKSEGSRAIGELMQKLSAQTRPKPAIGEPTFLTGPKSGRGTIALNEGTADWPVISSVNFDYKVVFENGVCGPGTQPPGPGASCGKWVVKTNVDKKQGPGQLYLGVEAKGTNYLQGMAGGTAAPEDNHWLEIVTIDQRAQRSAFSMPPAGRIFVLDPDAALFPSRNDLQLAEPGARAEILDCAYKDCTPRPARWDDFMESPAIASFRGQHAGNLWSNAPASATGGGESMTEIRRQLGLAPGTTASPTHSLLTGTLGVAGGLPVTLPDMMIRRLLQINNKVP